MRATDPAARPTPPSPESPIEASGHRATMLLEDPALLDAFARLESDIFAAWRSSPIDQAEAREWLYLRLAALGAVKDELRLIAEQGALAERERLRQERDVARRKTDGLVAGDPP